VAAANCRYSTVCGTAVASAQKLAAANNAPAGERAKHIRTPSIDFSGPIVDGAVGAAIDPTNAHPEAGAAIGTLCDPAGSEQPRGSSASTAPPPTDTGSPGTDPLVTRTAAERAALGARCPTIVATTRNTAATTSSPTAAAENTNPRD